VTETAAQHSPGSKAQPPAIRWSLPARIVTGFSGLPGLILKFALLAILNALAVWAGVVLASNERWPALAVLVLATVGIDFLYLQPRGLPLKFLVPGTVFLLAFQVVPVLYTIQVAFTNYSTGHILSKSEAVSTIEENTLAPPPDGQTYTLSPALDKDGNLALLLVDDASGKPYVGTEDGLEPLATSDVTIAEGLITAAPGYTLIKGARLFALDRELADFRVPVGKGAVHPEGIDSAVELAPTMRYDRKADTFTNISNGAVFRDNGKGAYASPTTNEQLEPGWKTTVGSKNFSRVLHDPLIRGPFVRVFAWTLAFATLTVVLSFALGLFLAVTLQKQFRFQRLYRTILIFPYAVPSFLTLLVWRGLLNDDFGVVNKLLHTSFPFLFDGTWAKGSVILVSLWLTFPYFFLVSLGALQSIPGDLVEAARVDGAGAWQVFRQITFPLLLVAVAPLMIASFAFNFNNFNNIFLLTGGGPPAGDASVAGETDILISYTYKIAFTAGRGTDYALAATVSIFIFLIVAMIATVSFWRSKTLEQIR